jgi:RNA polymerase sigma-70 factor (ECF subfamily)
MILDWAHMSFQRNPDASGVRSISSAGNITRNLAGSLEQRAGWTDEALMAAIMAGDTVAFDALYDRYADLVYSASLRVLGDRQLAEDAAQDVFVRLWQRPESFVAARGRFLSWLMSVARNRAVDELRSRGRRRRRETVVFDVADDLMAAQQHDEGPDPQLAAEVREAQLSVRQALVDLPGEQRRALELAYFGGYTQQQVASLMGEPLGTVKTRIRLGMQKLRAALGDQR